MPKQKDPIVLRSARQSDWDTIDETLGMDADSGAFDAELRKEISKAIDGMRVVRQPEQSNLVLINVDSLRLLLTDWHEDEATDRRAAGRHARRFIRRMMKQCAVSVIPASTVDDTAKSAVGEKRLAAAIGGSEHCPGCWTIPIDCTEGCGAKICTCNISTHDCDTFRAGGEA